MEKGTQEEQQKGPHRVPEENAFQKTGNEVQIYPRGFKITWGNDDRYWKKLEGDKKCAAELKQVSWLEVACSTKVESGKTYKVGFVVSLKPDAFGWKDVDVYVMAKVGKSGKYIYKKFQLDYPDKGEDEIRIPDKFNEPLKIKATSPEIHFGLYEVWNKKWKGGLIIKYAFIEETEPADPKNESSSS